VTAILTTHHQPLKQPRAKAPAKARAKPRTSPRTGPKRRKPPQLTAANSDPMWLYVQAVQSPDQEIDFVTREFQKLVGRPLRAMREDFSGSAAAACEFVRRHPQNRAVALDLHGPTLAWGRKHNVGALPPDAQKRVALLRRNVLAPGREGRNADSVSAMNFSYWIFKTRAEMLRYFTTVRESLVDDGIFFLDIHGGYESTKEMEERRRVSVGGGRWFKYVWEQVRFDPLSFHASCAISFEFERGPALKRAFTYNWRVWSVPEVRELLGEAGFPRVTVYWEGDDGRGGGNGVFRPKKKGEADASFISYIVAEKTPRR
jgi:hypothetical protein